jgi:hypothetical protein
MKKLIYLLLIPIASIKAQTGIDGIKVTRDLRPDPDYVTYEEWKAEHPEMGTLEGGPMVLRPAPHRAQAIVDDKGLIALVVAQDIQASISQKLTRYIADLEAKGYTVEQSTYSTAGTAEDLREYLKGIYGLRGAVLVGDLPAAWYQMNDDWNGDGEIEVDHDDYEEFPCDLYLSDLDGVWHDDSVFEANYTPLSGGSDGIYDSRTGNRSAEIWVCRIDASHITLEDQPALYQSYFDRDHAYRQAEFRLPSKGLFYIDQDWIDYYYDSAMGAICDEYDEIRDTMITDASDYEQRIQEEGLFLTVCVHSSPQAHYFHKANYGYSDILYNWKLDYLAPSYGFYNLFACSNCRWVEPDCMGSLYSLIGNGLASVGSSKTGSMLSFSEFNAPLAQGKSWGEAFLEWTNFWITYYGSSTQFQSWFMGMCLLGDATLDLMEQEAVEEASYQDPAAAQLDAQCLAAGQADIWFSIPKTCHVQLAVFDASGRLEATLYEGTLDAGERSLSWDAADAPAGVYFARLVTQGSPLAARIVLIN